MNPAIHNYDKLAQCKAWLGNNRLIIIAILLAFGLSMTGANWGVIECWNPDQMALRSIPRNLMMHDYLKPPLDTYIHKVFAIGPMEAICKGLLHHQGSPWLRERLMACRVFTTLLFCLAILLTYLGCLRFCGKQAAGVTSLLMATSAGLLAFNHYATADSPLHFWMVASFLLSLLAATNGSLLLSMASGLLAGLAAADKYNGLGVAAAIPAAFLVQDGIRGLLKKNFWIASFSVPVGFILGCPGVLFEQSRFAADFLYNLYTTPVYSGDISSAGYLKFLGCFPELIGWPGSVLLSICALCSLYLLLTRQLLKKELLLVVPAIVILFFYFVTIGRFPRMEPRFVLPAVPFVFFIAAPVFQRANRLKTLFATMFLLLLAYNIVSSWAMGMRFLDDPRMAAVEWASHHLNAGDLIESSYSPSWDKLVDGVKIIGMPNATGRAERFKSILGSHPEVINSLENHDPEVEIALFTEAKLKERNPDYVTFCSQAMEFSGPSLARQYYRDQLSESLGYRKVFERHGSPPSGYLYPKHLDFLADWMVILKRDH